MAGEPPDPRWPNLFIAGVPKAGTTSLHRYLNQHPEIFMSNPKETYFFNRVLDKADDNEDALRDQTAKYLSLFEDAGSARIRGESSPRYFTHPRVPERIAARVQTPRFIVSLRDPIQRAHSEYLMNRRDGVLDDPFVDVVEAEIEEGIGQDLSGALWPGLYATHLDRLWDTFGPEKVHVMLLDDLKDDPLEALMRIARFLDVSEEAMHEVDHKTQHNPYRVPRGPLSRWLMTNPAVVRLAKRLIPESWRILAGERVLSKRPRKPTIEPKARELLVEVYAPEIERLETMLDRDLPELQASWATD